MIMSYDVQLNSENMICLENLRQPATENVTGEGNFVCFWSEVGERERGGVPLFCHSSLRIRMTKGEKTKKASGIPRPFLYVIPNLFRISHAK